MRPLSVVLAFSFSLFFHTMFAQPATRVYAVQYAEGGPIYSSALDGSDLRSFRITGRPKVIAVDWTSTPQKIYLGLVATSGAGKIIRCNTDGTDTTDVVTNLIGINDIELDLTRRKVFWLQNTYQDDRIFHADMDGVNSNVTQIYATTVANRDLWGIALDPTNQRLWITERGSTCYDSELKRMSYTGGSRTTIRYPIFNPHDVEYFAGRIYWWERDGICSADGNGDNVDTIYAVTALIQIAINGSDGSIYWGDFTHYGIRRINADGTGDTSIISGVGALQSLDLDYNPSAVPVELSPPLPTACGLSECYPNPFNPLTRVELRMKNSEFLILKVYDVLGREVATLLNEMKGPGMYAVEFDGSGLSSGMYLCRMTTGNFSQTRKMLLLR